MDKFYPDQLVQMAIGGNGKALNFFKDGGMGRASTAGRAVDWQSKTALKYKTDLQKLSKQAAAGLGAAERAELDQLELEAAASAAGGGGTNGHSVEPAEPQVVWTVGAKMQFRDAGNPVWKWGQVTHCKPLKLDYKAHDDVRMSPASKIYNAEAQKAISFAAKPVAAAASAAAPAAAAAAAAAAAPSAAAAPASPTLAPVAPAPKAAASNMVIRGANGTAPAVRVANAGYDGASSAPAAPKKQAAEIDFGDDCFGDIGDMLSKAKKKASPKVTPQSSPKTGPAPAPGSPEAKPQAMPEPAKKPAVTEDDFDWDF